MSEFPRLLRQLETNRIYVALPALEQRADMVLLDPREVKKGSKGYEYVPTGLMGLSLEPEEPEEAAPVEDPFEDPALDPFEETVKADFVVDKRPNNMTIAELRKFAEEVNDRFPEFAIDLKARDIRSRMVSKCTDALNAIEALAKTE